MISYGITDKGIVRKANQDSFLVKANKEKALLVVCDGVGGNRAGEVASALSVKAMGQRFIRQFKAASGCEWIKKAVEDTNAAIYKKSKTVKEYVGMGTTLVAALVDEKGTYIANVGDSRCYIVDKEGNLVQITEDHTFINFLIHKKGLTEEEASKIVGKNVIARAVGIQDNVEVDTFQIDNDYQSILLCSDGLHGYVDEATILYILKSEKSVEDKCKELVQFANSAGGYDNITVVIYQR